MEIEKAMLHSVEEGSHPRIPTDIPNDVYIFPLVRRPFFPGMAAPIAIEPGPYYEVLKLVAKSEHKCVGLLLTVREDTDVYTASFDDLCEVGVLARVLRIIPMEQGGAQVILNMEKRMIIEKPIANTKYLKAKVSYHEDSSKLTQELKAYAISIISTIKELLKLNPYLKKNCKFSSATPTILSQVS